MLPWTIIKVRALLLRLQIKKIIFIAFYIFDKSKTKKMGRAFELRKGRKMKRWSAMSKIFTRMY